MNDSGLTIFFEKEALLTPDGYVMQPYRTRPRYSPDELNIVDWTGVDLQREVQGPTRDPQSVQHRVIELLRDEAPWDVIIDDHGPREAADVVLLIDRKIRRFTAVSRTSAERSTPTCGTDTCYGGSAASSKSRSRLATPRP